TPTSGSVDEEANAIWGWVEKRQRFREQPRESDGQFPGVLLLPGSMPAGRGFGLPSREGHTECSLNAGASKAFIEPVHLTVDAWLPSIQGQLRSDRRNELHRERASSVH